MRSLPLLFCLLRICASAIHQDDSDACLASGSVRLCTKPLSEERFAVVDPVSTSSSVEDLSNEGELNVAAVEVINKEVIAKANIIKVVNGEERNALDQSILWTIT